MFAKASYKGERRKFCVQQGTSLEDIQKELKRCFQFNPNDMEATWIDNQKNSKPLSTSSDLAQCFLDASTRNSTTIEIVLTDRPAKQTQESPQIIEKTDIGQGEESICKATMVPSNRKLSDDSQGLECLLRDMKSNTAITKESFDKDMEIIGQIINNLDNSGHCITEEILEALYIMGMDKKYPKSIAKLTEEASTRPYTDLKRIQTVIIEEGETYLGKPANENKLAAECCQPNQIEVNEKPASIELKANNPEAPAVIASPQVVQNSLSPSVLAGSLISLDAASREEINALIEEKLMKALQNNPLLLSHIELPKESYFCDFCNETVHSNTRYLSLVFKLSTVCEGCEAKNMHEGPLIKIEGPLDKRVVSKMTKHFDVIKQIFS